MSLHHRCCCLLILTALGFVLTPKGLALPLAAAPGERELVWIAFRTDAQRAQLARHLDIWEVERAPDAETGRLLAFVSLEERDWLLTQGFAPAGYRHAVAPATIPAYPCYRTIAELDAQLMAWADAYPTLTELHTIGASYEGRDLLVLRMTNEMSPATDRPIFFLMAGIHGRELITPELAMTFIRRLLEGYGRDPDITWLLDYQTIEVLVSANPDGHVRNETGEPWAYWRKNTNPSYGICGGTQFGVDLNRNSGFGWGNADGNPCSPIYQGPSAVSEPETQAVETFMRSLFPDQRPDDVTTLAPDTVSGLFVTLHSYGDLVLWPWGYTYNPAPNADDLARLGHKLAHFTGYVAKQASGLYPASGTTDDFAYGELGIPAYTFEVGDQFYPPCEQHPALIEPNISALLYAAKVSRAPYRLPAGPDVVDIRQSILAPAVVRTADAGSDLVIAADLDDGQNGGQLIQAAEATLDAPPWAGGEPVPLAPVDGVFDAVRETVTGTLAIDDVTPGLHTLFIRGQDGAGNWGPVSATFVTVTRGLSLKPVASVRVGRPGEVVRHTLLITNTGLLSQTLTFTHTTGRWPVALTPTLTHPLPGASVPVSVTVALPSLPTAVREDTITLTVTAADAPWLDKVVPITTRGLWPSAYLPFVIRE